MRKDAFKVFLPDELSTSVVFASPHSGRDYPWSFLRRSVLDELSIRSSEDAYVDQLFAAAPTHGAPLLVAQAPRAFVDLNRGADELDPAVVTGVRRSGHNPRVSSGLGVIPRVVANGRAIYRGKLDLAEAQTRLDEVWHPYHATLQGLLDDSKARFGEAILIDCHSMPHEAIETLGGTARRKPEIVLGDRFGAACDPGIIDQVEAIMAEAGLRVARNAPFAGAYITQHYGRPSHRQHVVQIEIDRSLYMNEAEVRPNRHFAAFMRLMSSVVGALTEIGRPGETVPLAAE